IAHFPGTVEYILSEYDRVTAEGGRLSDVLSGYIDPDDGIAPPAEVPPPVDPKAPAKDDSDDEDEEKEDGDEEEETESGPDPEVARQRFGAVQEQLNATLKVLKKNGRQHKDSLQAMLELAELFMPIKLVPKQFEVLVERVRSALDRLRQQERAIMQLCVRDARMPRADFLRLFPSNEIDQTWASDLAKRSTKWAAALGEKSDAIVACQQKLIDLESETGLTIAEIKDINRRMSIGEAKA
ncbi:MAG: sigma-70 non-essential region-containing protein, partial [Pseudomonas sp.]